MPSPPDFIAFLFALSPEPFKIFALLAFLGLSAL